MRVQGEPSSKTLISDPPIGGSTDHVDQRGVWGKKYFFSIKAKAILKLVFWVLNLRNCQENGFNQKKVY